MVSRKDLWAMLKEASESWLDDNAPRLGAALAYYTTFSLAPLLLIMVALAGRVFGDQAARGELHKQITDWVGLEGGKAVEAMLANAKYMGSGIVATIVGGIALLIGATGLFTELQGALNTVWGVQAKSGRGVWGIVKDRALSFAMVLGSALLLLASLIVSAVLDGITTHLGNWAHPVLAGQVINFLISFGVITLLFAMIYRFLPDVVIAWKDVWLGALVTSLLFAVGKYLIGLYLGHSAAASAYGAAGSLAMLLLWLYYSAQIFLFGAELTKAYANRYGGRLPPRENAEVICPQKK